MNNISSLFSRSQKRQPFEQFLAPHIRSLYHQSYRYMGNSSDADDLLQDLLLELFGKQEQMAAVDNMESWLNRCLYNSFIDRCRRSDRLPAMEDVDEFELNDDNIASAEYYCLNQQVLRYLQRLSPIHRAVISLHDVDGYTLPELSTVLDMPVGTLKSHLHRARKKIKLYLQMQPFETSQRLSCKGR